MSKSKEPDALQEQAAGNVAADLAAAAGSLSTSEETPKAFVNQPDRPGAFEVKTADFVVSNNTSVEAVAEVEPEYSVQEFNGFTIKTNVAVRTDVNWAGPEPVAEA